MNPHKFISLQFNSPTQQYCATQNGSNEFFKGWKGGRVDLERCEGDGNKYDQNNFIEIFKKN